MRWARHVTRTGEVNEYTMLVGGPEWKRPLGRPRRRWVIVLVRILRDVSCEGVDWIHLSQETEQRPAFVNTVMNLPVP